MLQVAAPIMRQQGRGRIVQISSLGGIGAFANLGAYKRVEVGSRGPVGVSSVELAPFGITVTIVEPGGYETDWAGASSRWSAPLPHYEPIRRRSGGGLRSWHRRIRPRRMGEVGVGKRGRSRLMALRPRPTVTTCVIGRYLGTEPRCMCQKPVQ